MGRTRSPSALGWILSGLTKLPWWVLLAFGVAGAWWARALLSSRPIVAPVIERHPWVEFFPSTLVLGLFAMLALASFLQRRRRQQLLARHTTLAHLQQMRWQDFERLVGEAYRRQGYAVKETGLGGADGGVDLVLSKGRQTILVQCKRWKTASIGASIVREMWGLAHHHNASGVKVVTVGRFTAAARDFARGKNLDLIDGPALVELLGSVRGKRAVAPNLETASPQSPHALAPGHPAATVSRIGRSAGAPSCPDCGASMVNRLSRKDGEQFWGCPAYPRCRGTRSMK